MRLGRRAFLKLVAILSAFAYALRPARALAAESAVSIHRATRNTLLGALGAGLREMQASLQPFKTYPGREHIRLGPKPSTVGGPALVEALGRAYAATKAKVDESAANTSASRGNDGVPNDAKTRVPQPPAPRALTRDVLGRLLYFTNGDTGIDDGDPYRLRAAPSAGALYAGELYVVALAVTDLERGVYYYDVGANDLVQVRPADELPSLDDAFEDSTFMTGAAAVVLISNVFERYQQRYSNRGYRYALIDTGHIGENLRIAAAAAGIDHEAQPRFIDTQLDALVGADGEDEAVCAVHVLGRSAPAAAPNGTPPVQARFVEKAVTGAHAIDDSDPTVRYHASTTLVRGQAKKTRGESPDDTTTNAAAPAQPATSQPPIALASADPPPSTSAEACIASRRSPKSFAERPISAAQLGFVARAAYPAEAWRRSLGVELQLVVHRVDGVAPGLYRYVPEQAALEVVKLDDYTESLPRVCLGQSKAGDAAAGFAMVAHIERAAAEHGERAYRDLLVEAGEMGERVYLAAEALGLCARNLASFIDEDLNSLIGLDGADAAVVHLTMLGHGT